MQLRMTLTRLLLLFFTVQQIAVTAGKIVVIYLRLC